MNKKTIAKIELIVSMAIFGTLAPFVRNVPVSSGELALYRAVLAAALIGIYLLITKSKSLLNSGKQKSENAVSTNANQSKKELLFLFLSGVAMGINWILLFEAYKYTTVSAATLSYYFAPVLVTIICPFLFHEKLKKLQILCFVMSTLGLILIIGVGSNSLTGSGSDGNGILTSSQAGTDLIGILFGLGAAVFYATVVLLNKFIKNVTGIHRTFLQFLAAIATLLPYVLCTSGLQFGTLDAKGWINLLIVGLFHTGITYCMYFSSLKELPGQEAAILSYIDPLTAVLVSLFILGESITVLQVVGGILILGFAILNEKTADQ